MLPAARWRAPLPQQRNAAASSSLSIDEFKQNLGRKVSIRYCLHDDPAHPFSEAIGMIQSVSADDVIEIVNRRGEVASVPIDDIEAAKLFPQ
jgi:ribosome maturation factor RimP